jgi:hypothetical protein
MAFFDHLARQHFLQNIATGCDHGLPSLEDYVPVRETRLSIAPSVAGEPQIEITKRAARRAACGGQINFVPI